MRELATAIDSSAPKLSKAATRLEKRGLLERVSCAGDKRVEERVALRQLGDVQVNEGLLTVTIPPVSWNAIALA